MMTAPSRYRAAQLALGVLIVVVIRSLSEFLRLYDPGAAPIGPELFVYIYGALAAGVAALLVLILHAFNRHLSAIVLGIVAIVGLLIYKIIATM